MSVDTPLAGVRILDFTTAWAGPMAGRVLAFLGADVIHVEHATRVDLWRHHRQAYRPWLYPAGDGGEQRYNRNAQFNSQNINKRSLTLDLKQPRGLELALDLAAKCDIVLSNFTPGALARAGLDYQSLKAINPKIIYAEMPAYGNSGPKSAALAVGGTMEMAAGMTSLIGYPRGKPQTTGPNYMDPIGGYNAAAAILTALVHRQHSGQGQYVEVPQVEAAMHFIGAELLAAAASGKDPERVGNRVDWAAPHDAFPALGDDEWVAIAVMDDAAWRALSEVIGIAQDERFAALAGRQGHEDEIGAMISRWSSGIDKCHAAEMLQRAGVPAAPVLNAAEVSASSFLAARGFFTTLDHPEAGRHAYQGIPIHLSRTPGADHRAAPTIGQDTSAILRDLLGLGDEAIAALEADGTTSSKPA
jgi:crotonobetainyl-CoA:carnitine CoA-transferase CaiB-like acyl-CoA transferase